MKTKYLAIAAAALALVACDKNNDDLNIDNLKDTPITVTAMVGELVSTRTGYETNAEDASKSVLPEKFYLTVTQEAGIEDSKYNYTDVEMTKGTNNSYTPEGVQMLWKDETPSVSAITAYTIDTGTDVKVQTNQSTSDNVVASDLLGAIYTTDNNSDITITGANIGINFRHLLCKLDITLSWGTELDNATTKEITGVTISGLNTTATLNRTTAAITDGATVADINAYTVTSNEGDTYTAEAIFTPSTANPAITIFTKIDDVERVFSLTPTAPEDGFTSGNRYTVNITVGGTIVNDVTATVANGWTTGKGGNMATE